MAQATFKIKIWISLAIATASLVLASGASAMYNAQDDAGAVATPPPTPVVGGSSGFDWADAFIGAAIAAAVIVAGIAVARLARGRGRLVASH